MKHILKYTRKFCLAFVTVAVLLIVFSQRAEASERTIRVGYSDLDGMTRNADGSYTGYLADYLDEVSQYTGWEYEYVFDTWNNCLEKLKKGELDLLGLTNYTVERAEVFRYSDLSMYHDDIFLYAAADRDIYYQEYEAIDHSTVGIIEGSSPEIFLEEYEKELGISFQKKFFDSKEEALAALRGGEIDLLAVMGMADVSDTKIIDQFYVMPAYFITGMENKALMQELNAAMRHLYAENSELESELTAKYRTSGADELYLTRQEQEYIDSAGTITVRSFDGRRPLSYTDENGNLVGMLIDYLDKLGKVSGLTFSYDTIDAFPTEQEAEYLEETDDVLISGNNILESYGVYKTDPLFEVSMSYIMPKGYSSPIGAGSVFAITNAMSFLEETLKTGSYPYVIRYYDSPEECMEAVIKGEADITIQYEYVAVYLLQKPRYAEKLMDMPGTDYSVGFSVFATEENELLISILNKSLRSISNEQQMSVIADAMLAHSYEKNLSDYLYLYGGKAILGLAVGAIVILILMIRGRALKEQQQKEENTELQRKLRTDEITGVYNKVGFFEQAGQMIRRLNGDVCMVRVNIHHFKLVNELYGLDKGDRLLQELGIHLTEQIKEADAIVGRFSADSFYLCVDRKDLDKIHFSRQISCTWLNMDISLNYGIYPVEGQVDLPLNIICDRADMANMSGKMTGDNYIFYYSDEERQRLLREQEIEGEMEKALEEGQFCIYVQPQYDIETEQIVSGEVLVRWFHPEKGMIPPVHFIELFERNGFIRRLDYYVWEQACRYISEARKIGLPTFSLSVNVSRIHFYNHDLVNLLMELLERYNLEAKDLELEITETMYAEESDIITDICRQLRNKGFKIAMDDFGSGYSSLNMLKEMPIDIIKMDLHFLSGEKDSVQEEKGRSILHTLIELVHNLELQVIVEGVETKEQKEFIKEIGACTVQGYYFARPMPTSEFTKLVSEEEQTSGGVSLERKKMADTQLKRRAPLLTENRRLKEEEKILTLIAQHSDRVVCYYDVQKRMSRVWDKDVCKKCMLPHLCEMTVDDLFTSGQIMPESLGALRHMFQDIEAGKANGSMKLLTRTDENKPLLFDMQYSTVCDENGVPKSALISHKDITAQHDHEMAYLRQLQSLSEAQSLGSMDVDLNTNLIEQQSSKFAPAGSSCVGDTLTDFAERMISLKMYDSDRESGLLFFSREYLLQEYEKGSRLLTRTWPMHLLSGKEGWIRVDAELIADPYTEHIKAFFRIWNVTESQRKQMEIRRRSEIDGMTGLLNRATAEDHIRREIAQKRAPGILILLDLDELKQINDKFGHAEGDNAIKHIAHTLKAHFRETDIIGRAGGDEFILYLPGAAKSRERIAVSLENLMHELAEMTIGTADGRRVGCSIGCAAEQEDSTFESLFGQADKTLYHVKRRGRNGFAFYSEKMEND